jgi:peroxiredoxin
MARTLSTMLPLQTRAPDFTLPDAVSGARRSRDAVRGPAGLLVMFICNHCPYVQHVNSELVRLARDVMPKGLGIVAISSNDARAYPEDGPDAMRDTAVRLGYPFPYLFDATQDVARAYDAACTPDFFLFDRALDLVYRGRLDDSTPGNGRPVTGGDLRAAIDAVLANRTVDPDQQPSMGCNIKWAKTRT